LRLLSSVSACCCSCARTSRSSATAASHSAALASAAACVWTILSSAACANAGRAVKSQEELSSRIKLRAFITATESAQSSPGPPAQLQEEWSRRKNIGGAALGSHRSPAQSQEESKLKPWTAARTVVLSSVGTSAASEAQARRQEQPDQDCNALETRVNSRTQAGGSFASWSVSPYPAPCIMCAHLEGVGNTVVFCQGHTAALEQQLVDTRHQQ